MTVSANPGRVIFTGNDVATEFSYSYMFFATDELVLTLYDTTTQTETELTGAQYSIAVTGSSPYSSATITYPLSGDPLSTTEQLVVNRVADLDQDVDLSNQASYFLESIETQLDRLATWNQSIQDQLDRALILPVSTELGKKITMGPPVAEAVLRWPDDVSGDCLLESVDLVDLIVEDSEIQAVIEDSFAGQLFIDAWAREFGDICDGSLQTDFNADQVDGYDVLTGTTPASGLLKVGDYGVTLSAIDISSTDLDALLSSGSYRGNNLTNAPDTDYYFVQVTGDGSTEVIQKIINYGYADVIYTRAYSSSAWSNWYRIWAGTSGTVVTGLNADQVDGYDVSSSPIPTTGLLKVGDWGTTYQTLNFTGFDVDTVVTTLACHGTSMLNAPDSGGWFIQAFGDGTYATQTAISQSNGEVRQRYFNGSVWSSWTDAVTYDNHTHTESDITDLDKYTQSEIDTALSLKANLSLVGAVSGICPLDGSGLVDSSYLPSYVDDVVEVADYASLPGTGETGKIYVTLDTGNIYRWGGSAYIEINTSVATADEAVALATARLIQLGGDASGSASFDGTADITITATVNDSAALGGVAAASWLRADTADAVSGVLTFSAAPVLANAILLAGTTTGAAIYGLVGINGSDQAIFGNVSLPLALVSNGTITHNGFTVWTSNNDGTLSGLDADLLDGVHLTSLAQLSAQNIFTDYQTIESTSPRIRLRETDTTTMGLINQDSGNLYIQASASSYTGSGNILFSGLSNTDIGTFQVRYGGNYRDIYHTGNDTPLLKRASKKYAANVNSSTFWTIIRPSGDAITSSYSYRLTLTTYGTSTNTGNVYLLTNTDSGGWDIHKVAVQSEDSNQPSVFLDSGVPKVKTNHATLYGVDIFIEEFESLATSNTQPSIWGSDFHFFSDSDHAYYRTLSGYSAYELYHTGNDSNLAKINGNNAFTGTNTFDETINIWNATTTDLGISIKRNSTEVATITGNSDGVAINGSQVIKFKTGGTEYARIDAVGKFVSYVTTGTAPMSVASTTVCTNLNADLLDGYHGDKNATINTAVIRTTTGAVQGVSLVTGVDGGGDSSVLFYDNNSAVFRYLKWSDSNNDWRVTDNTGIERTLWTSGNDGTGSGLDADLLDGQHGSYYATDSAVVHLAGTETITGAKTFTQAITLDSAADSNFLLDAASTSNLSQIMFYAAGAAQGKMTYAHNATDASEALNFYIGGVATPRCSIYGSGNMTVTGTIQAGGYTKAQGSPTAKTVSATLTAAEIDARIITVNNGAAGSTTLTLPTGSDMDTYFSGVALNYSFDFNVINISTVAAEDCTIAAGTGWTIVGNPFIESYETSTSHNNRRFIARRTAAATWTLYCL